MAARDQAYSTGALQSDELRKRNVAPSQVNGSTAPIQVDEKTKEKAKSALSTWDEIEPFLAPLLFTALAFFTRFWKIDRSNIVTWDEAHFGKFASHYLQREFYFDVHPPLGKMLNGLAGWAGGYNGSFEFKSGEEYPEYVNFKLMRQFNALWGALCIPLAYYTASAMHFRRPTVWLVTMAVLFENSYTTISRFILLDSMLLFFTFTTVFCWAKWHNAQQKPFSAEWALWLGMTGLSIGCVCSVKWVGMFGTALVGLYTIEELWNHFGNVKMSPVTLGAHLGFRVFGLIVIPMIVYMLSFAAHFYILENSGPGDAQMSSLFQANLKGTEIGKDSPLEVAYGSRVTLKNMGYGGGLLHSHVQTYPEGSQQQQVTCYHHHDANNEFFWYPNRDEPEFDPTSPIKMLGNGEVVRLIHAQTGRNLHSHQVAAPVTKADYEVSCYGNTTVGDTKDHWVIDIIDDAASSDYSRLRTLTTSFRLRHADLNCYLRAGTVNLPQWGFKQIETTCTKDNNPRDIYQRWNVESHWNDRLENGNAGQYKSPFFRDFVHLNVAMMTSNNALVPDPDKQDDLSSSFWEWPILHVGLRMCGWDNNIVKYFLLGNPLVYWGSTFSVFAFFGMLAFYLIRWQRGYNDLSQAEIDQIHYAGIYPVIGWFLHYLPFIIMGRVTYVHHYYPALYFAILCAGFCVDFGTRRLNKVFQAVIFMTLYVVTVGLFVLFRDICFGIEGDAKTKMSHLKWFNSWRLHD